MKLKSFFLIVILWIQFSGLYSLTVGSDSVVSVAGHVTFPRGLNEMRGFAAFSSGFSLFDNRTTVSFNDAFPVSRIVNMNGGVIDLTTRLFFDSATSLLATGSFVGNDLRIDFAETMTYFSHSRTSADPVFTFVDSLTLGEEARSVDWRAGDAHFAAGIRTGVVDELEAFSFDGASIASVDSASVTQDVNGARWHPTEDRLATVQDLSAVPELRIWSFNPTTETFTQVDSADAADDLQAVAWRPQGDHIAIGGRVPNVDVYPVDGSGNLGTIINADTDPSDRPNRNAIEWDDSGNYFAVGVRQSAGTELLIYYFDGTNLTFTVGAHIGDDVSGVSWSSTGTFIAVGIGAGVTETLRVYEHHVWDGTLTENTAARVGETVDVETVDWSSDGNYLAVGRKTAVGSDVFIYEFDKNAVTLTEIFSADVGDDVNDIRWSHDDGYVVVALGNQNIEVYSVAFEINTVQTTSLDSVQLHLKENIKWAAPTDFFGDCEIDGGSGILKIVEDASITIHPNSSLLLRNIEVHGLRDTNIKCLDDSASLRLDKAVMHLSHDYSFTTGSIGFDGDTVFTGTNKFTYSSTQASTLASQSSLIFARDTTFSYVPSNNANDLLVLTDLHSILKFDESNFHVGSGGIELTKGMLIIGQKCHFSNDGTQASEGISFGDGTVSGNIDVDFAHSSQLILDSGFLVYNNV